MPQRHRQSCRAPPPPTSLFFPLHFYRRVVEEKKGKPRPERASRGGHNARARKSRQLGLACDRIVGRLACRSYPSRQVARSFENWIGYRTKVRMNAPEVPQDIKMQGTGFDAFWSSLAQAFEVPF